MRWVLRDARVLKLGLSTAGRCRLIAFGIVYSLDGWQVLKSAGFAGQQPPGGDACLVERRPVRRVAAQQSLYLVLGCPRRFNIDHPCRLNFDQGLELSF